MSKILDFSEMLLTKLCHDLAGALGAVDNGIEFLDMNEDPALNDKAMELVRNNSNEAVIKLKFYRFLYGVTKSDGELDFKEIKKITEDYFSIGGHQLDWQKVDGGTISLTAKGFKLLVNLLYINSMVLLGGGELSVEYHKKDSGKQITIVGTGTKLHEIDDIKHILSDHELRDVKLNNVQIHYTAKIAAELGAVINLHVKDNNFEIKCDFTS